MDPSVSSLTPMLPQIAREAQSVYDAWTQDSDGHDEEFGYGGICHSIADAIAGVLEGHGVEAATVSQSIGEVHVYVVARFREGVYTIDIPPGTYETGSAYTWRKRQGVEIGPEDIVVSQIDKNASNFEQYVESRPGFGFRDWLAESFPSFIVRRTWPSLIASEMESPSRRSSRKGRRSCRR